MINDPSCSVRRRDRRQTGSSRSFLSPLPHWLHVEKTETVKYRQRDNGDLGERRPAIQGRNSPRAHIHTQAPKRTPKRPFALLAPRKIGTGFSRFHRRRRSLRANFNNARRQGDCRRSPSVIKSFSQTHQSLACMSTEERRTSSLLPECHQPLVLLHSSSSSTILRKGS